MAYVPKIVIDDAVYALAHHDQMYLREAVDTVEALEDQLRQARQRLIRCRNDRTKLARFIRENSPGD